MRDIAVFLLGAFVMALSMVVAFCWTIAKCEPPCDNRKKGEPAFDWDRYERMKNKSHTEPK